MGISEMQRQFNAYGSGELPEFELRRFLRIALSEEPQLSQAFAALTDAYRRANLIDANLQSTIKADIAEICGASLGLTMVRAPGFGRTGSAWMADDRAANSTDVNIASGATNGSLPRMGPAGSTGPSPADTGSTDSSNWDLEARLGDVAAPLYPGAVIRDRFVLVEELGRGGMGVVYKAYDRSRGDVKDRYVAIKVLNDEFKRHPLAVRSLQREARKAQRLAHPNVVGVHDFDRDGGNVYMVMEFLSGRSLEQVLREDGQGGIPLGPAMEIIKSLGAALSYAHEQDIVHCDFKPSNAFLNRDGKVKVLDFGIARAAPSLLEKGEATLFDAGQLGAISPAYASLEMLQRETPDVRDDVYAFACVAYELLTGAHPYQRIDAVKAYQTQLQPRPIRKLSRAQWRALKQGLEFQRADRCPTIDSLVNQLVTRPSRANLWIAAGAAGVAALSIAGVLAWKWTEVERTAGHLRIWPTSQSTGQSPPRHASTETGSEPGGAAQSRTSETVAESTNASTPVPTLSHTADPSPPANAQPDESSRDLDAALSKPEPTDAWAAKVRALLQKRAAVAPPEDALVQRGRQTAVTTFVAAAADSRSRKQFEQASGLLATARSFNELAPEIVSEAVALDRDKTSQSEAHTPAVEEKRAGVEMLKEQFETQAAAGDVAAAAATAKNLARALPGSVYVSRDMPQILIGGYAHLAKTQLGAGRVEDALQTLADGRKQFAKSPELKDLQARYVAIADVYDHLSTAVALNVTSWKRSLDELKSSEGNEYETDAQMLAQTLADRIADQRAANRQAVADSLLEQGKQIFPDYVGILGRGTAGMLPATPIIVDDN